MTWHRLANSWRSFTSLLGTTNSAVAQFDLPPMMTTAKLSTALPQILGRTIDHVVLVGRRGEASQMFFAFRDGTHYEFYGIGTLSGARGVDWGGVERLGPFVVGAESVTVIR